MVWEGRFRYSDLKEAARRASRWILYVVDQAAEVQSCVLAAVRGSCSARSYSLRGLAEAGEKADRALWAS